MPGLNSFGAYGKYGEYSIFRLDALTRSGIVGSLDRLPYSIRILLESLLRHEDGHLVTREDVERLARWDASQLSAKELPFVPARIIMQDFTGGACIADLAAMRDALHRLGHDPLKINPRLPVDLVIDHTVIVDYSGSPDAARKNTALGYLRNRERYQFFKWAAQAFRNLRVVPPATGIIHQVNLEYLAQGVIAREGELFPDTVLGTDSHTPMINGLGVVGWGVGGIEAEAVMLGQPLYILTPQVIGLKLSCALREGVTCTDLILTITQLLRRKGVVDKFVEFYGPGVAGISLADRATIANMAPEYGATMGFFPTDEETLRYLSLTGRARSAALLERYAKEQGLFRSDEAPTPQFTDTVELDLREVEPCLAGPKKPEQRVRVRDLRNHFRTTLVAPVGQGGYGLSPSQAREPIAKASIPRPPLTHGSVVLAAITSCTNTSNPSALIAAGLIARRLAEQGLCVPSHVKTAFSPGSKVVVEYLAQSGLMPHLERLGFYQTGYGCAVCVGNSGPLPETVSRAIRESKLVAAAVLSGNRNFEGRIHPDIRANFLASPLLVVAYAVAGTTDIDLETEPLGKAKDGRPVFLRDVLPSQQEIADTLAKALQPEMFTRVYANVFDGDPAWNALHVPESDLFEWDPNSTYLVEPPFLKEWHAGGGRLRELRGARALALLGNGITTDHISPVGSIPLDSPAGQYLASRGVAPKDFNQYGTRRGNHEVMMRGAFANIRLKNLLLGGEEGGKTIHMPDGERMTIFDAAQRYKADGVPLIVIAGREYGTGSSRDWAAKAPALLGVKAILAESFERIHRSNLVGIGLLPLQFRAGENAGTLGLTGREEYEIRGISDDLRPRQEVTVIARDTGGKETTFHVVVRLDTPVELEYHKDGGILQTVLRKLDAL